MQLSKLRFRKLGFPILALIAGLLCHSPVFAATLAVLYPEVKAPYRQVFEQILEGISSDHKDRLLKIPLPGDFSKREVLEQLAASEVDMVITLGRRSFSLTSELQGLYPFVSGALPLSPDKVAEGVSGLSLIADPDALFGQLKELAPRSKRVFVVYTARSGWLMDLAARAASDKGLELITYEVSDLAEALDRYKEILARARSQQDAIWLPLDRISANEKVILPLLLREAWLRKLVLFSSKPSHARHGTLFSIYPDNQRSGARLAQMVREIYETRTHTGVEPLKALKVGVNLRTAAHLGLEYNSSQKRSFYATFPTP